MRLPAIPGLIDLTIGSVGSVGPRIENYCTVKELFNVYLYVSSIQVMQLKICLEFVGDVTAFLTEDVNAQSYNTLSRLSQSLDAALITLDRRIDRDKNVRRLWYTTLGKSAHKKDRLG